MSNVYCGKAIIIKAPAGGVVANKGYITEYLFFYSLQTKNEGEDVLDLIDNCIVPLPYEGAGRPAGSKITRGMIYKFGDVSEILA